VIYGIGTDLIEVDRVKKQIESDNGFKERVFTPVEITYCDSKRHRYQHYAGRFAAKEAFMKALGTGWQEGVSFQDIEVVTAPNGKPELKLYNKTSEITNSKYIQSMFVSLSHLASFAMAIVILEQ
jgi:holo-[acyl-carrier protein] synthase